jgi:hypothetical protein
MRCNGRILCARVAPALLVQFLFLANTPHSSSTITAAATCFDELILGAEMYEQSSESTHACVVKYIRARLVLFGHLNRHFIVHVALSAGNYLSRPAPVRSV